MREKITYANVAATLALVFAMSGGALAANHYLINSTKQINPKVIKKLKGATGKTGLAGATGKTGAIGAAGASGKEGPGGKEGPRGKGFTNSGRTEKFQTCTLSTTTTTCFAEPSIAFTPTVDEKCLVTVASQINTKTPGKPTVDGPYFRIEIKENSTEESDEVHGNYFEGTFGEQSTAQERTRLIDVKAGQTYTFGVYYGLVGGEWIAKVANFQVTYNCFA
jgi:hypothetical protein